MLSRVQWLKEYEKYLLCCTMNPEYCSYDNCQDCEFDCYDGKDLLSEARNIFNYQLFIENNNTDDGK